MSKLARNAFIGTVCFFLFFYNAALCLSDESLDESKQLLQKSLTVYEIDQEVLRLTAQETKVSAQIAEAEQQIAVKAGQVAVKRQHAGKVLRAYYMGERDSVWMLLFSSKSFSDALVVFEYLSMIFQNDRQNLTAYQSSYQELVQLRSGLETTKNELEQVKSEFLKQRERAVALQEELDAQLKASSNAAAIQTQMADLTAQWQEKGVPLFKTYFQAISQAMQSLPEVLTGKDKNKYLDGLTFHITDTDLNTFFRSKNSLFNNMTFQFAKGQFIVSGKDQDTEVSIKGHYSVEQTPKNKLQFHVDELTFNGYILPDTTNRSLEQEFDLGFSPESYLPMIQATDVLMEDGLLTIKLKLNLK